jgi:hypothetical protein
MKISLCDIKAYEKQIFYENNGVLSRLSLSIPCLGKRKICTYDDSGEINRESF